MEKLKRNRISVCSMLLVTALVLSSLGLLEGQTAIAPEMGDGTEGNPYQIATLENLFWIAAGNNVVPEPSLAARLSSHYIQTANIRAIETRQWFNRQGWSPIGHNYENAFRGSYNGQEYVIDGLYINRRDDRTGLFGIVLSVTIENLGVTNVDISGSSKVAGLVGDYRNSTISNCYSTGNVAGEGNYIGGLVGESFNSNISNSYSTCSVTGIDRVGGLVGYVRRFTISNSYSTGSVTGERHVGGLVGEITPGSTIINSYYNYERVLVNESNYITIGALNNELYTAWLENDLSLDIDDYLDFDGDRYLINSVNDLKKLLAFGQFEEYSFGLTANLDLEEYPDFYVPYFVGDFDGNGFTINNLTIAMGSFSYIGLFGFISLWSTIENLGVTNVAITGNYYVGSLVGRSYRATISNCYSTGNVLGKIWVGGLVGRTVATINNCYSTVSVSGWSNIGGLVGWAKNSTLSNSYSKGSVTGNSDVGGLLGGIFTSNIINSYSTGKVIGDRYAGGLVAGHVHNPFISNSYWDMQTSGMNFSYGGDGRTTAQMTYPYTANTFVNWVFEDIWVGDSSEINDGYPYLRWQLRIEPDIAANPLPEDSASHVFVDLDLLSWNYLHNPFRSTPTGFRFYFNDTGEFGGDDDFVWVPYIEEEESYATGEILPDLLEYNTGYYWKVVPTTKEEGIGEGSDAQNVPVWSFTTEAYPTSVDLFDPELFTSLHGNYPNPFNPQTVIEFSIKEETEAILHIFNLKGQLVKTLHSGTIKAGEHSLIWNGKDDNNRDVSSGVYFYRLKTDHYEQVNKMLLVK